MAEQRGAVLPPISVVAVGDAYAIRDGHHRVSVARARGALTHRRDRRYLDKVGCYTSFSIGTFTRLPHSVHEPS